LPILAKQIKLLKTFNSGMLEEI